MKRDGREPDHKTLEDIWRMAVQRVREGETPSEVIASYGFHCASIYRWLNPVDRAPRPASVDLGGLGDQCAR